MADHLLDHVRPHLDRSVEDRIAYIRAPRWIGHHVAIQAHRRLAELLSRPPALRTRGLMLVGPYANGKTMIAERFAVEGLYQPKTAISLKSMACHAILPA